LALRSRRNYGAGGDAALVSFDLNAGTARRRVGGARGGARSLLPSVDVTCADFTPSWNWNTKQVFVYAFFEYATKKNPLNQVIVWDRIIRHKQDAVLSEQAISAEYVLADQGYNLKNTDAVLRVGWDITPIAGPLIGGHSNGTRLTFPSEYIM
jgi:hypothetical protein